ncbi:MAG: LEA type 2 family protein [Gammaproteobacteria bacterium]|nr:LEA type 2 family protein [Gammaproteobacteria bacterium]
MSESGVASRCCWYGFMLLLPLLSGGCALFKGDLEVPKVTLSAVTPEKLARGSQVLRCRLLLENPNNQDLRVIGGKVRLEIDGVTAGQGETIEGFMLPALDSREVDLRVTLDLLSTLSGALRSLGSGKPALEYALQGYVDLDVKALGRLPFRSSGTIQLEDLLRHAPGLLRSMPEPEKTI